MARRAYQKVVSVPNASALILGANKYRRSILISNTSSNTCYVSFGVPAAPNVGVYVSNVVPPLYLSEPEWSELAKLDVYAFANSANTPLTLLITEEVPD